MGGRSVAKTLYCHSIKSNAMSEANCEKGWGDEWQGAKDERSEATTVYCHSTNLTTFCSSLCSLPRSLLCSSQFGCIVGMPFTLMGLTIVAAGTSVPDAISSVVVAKAGQGDMAVSNAIGSNVFDILLGLGLPYFISNVVRDVSPSVEVDDLLPSICILYGILAAVILILWWSGWMLNPKVGMSLLGIYIIYVIFAYAHMLNK